MRCHVPAHAFYHKQPLRQMPAKRDIRVTAHGPSPVVNGSNSTGLLGFRCFPSSPVMLGPYGAMDRWPTTTALHCRATPVQPRQSLLKKGLVRESTCMDHIARHGLPRH